MFGRREGVLHRLSAVLLVALLAACISSRDEVAGPQASGQSDNPGQGGRASLADPSPAEGSAETPWSDELPPQAAPSLAAAANILPSAGDDALIAEHMFTPDQVGYAVYDTTDGRLLASRNINALFMPASVTKLPTSVMALEVLGPDYRFSTKLVATGEVVDGVLNGNLYLVGGADPQLGPIQLSYFVKRLRAEGIRRVAGQLHYDESFLVSRQAIEPMQPGDARYNPGVSALSLTYNRIKVSWHRKETGDGVRARALSHSERMQVPLQSFSLAAAPFGKDDWLKFQYAGESDGKFPGPRWLISARLGPEGDAWLPVKKPGAYTARVFRAIAAQEGITLPWPSPGAAPSSGRVVHQYDSRPLVEIVEDTLKHSNNLMAELMGLTATRLLLRQPLDLEKSGAIQAAWFVHRADGADWKGVRFANHSGLSTETRVSPGQLAAVLRYAESRRDAGLGYQAVLPFKAWPGDESFDKTAFIRAKSGTMKYARGLAGFAQVAGDRPLGFVVLVNDLAERRTYDADSKVRTPWMRAKAQKWVWRAKALEQSLIRSWLKQFGKSETFASAPHAGGLF